MNFVFNDKGNNWKLKTTKNNTIFKLIPIFGIILLTLVLMLVFKFTRNETTSLIEDGKSLLNEFYTENLKPLIFQSELTNEDVFNFALYQNLPLDKEKNKVLQVGSEPAGNEYYEIKPVSVKQNTKNYEKFIEHLELSNQQISTLDSILSYYKNDLSSSVFVGEKGIVAVDQNLYLVRNALNNDLQEFEKQLLASRDADQTLRSPTFKSIYNQDKKSESGALKDLQDFIIFTPDSIFTTEFDFDKEKFSSEIKKYQDNIRVVNSNLANLGLNIKIREKKLKDKSNSVIMNVVLGPEIQKAILPFEKKIESSVKISAGKNERPKSSEVFSFNIDADTSKNKFSFALDASDKDSVFSLDFEFNLQELDTLLNSHLKELEKNNFSDWEKFGVKIDSIAGMYQIKLGDSLLRIQQRKSDNKKDQNRKN